MRLILVLGVLLSGSLISPFAGEAAEPTAEQLRFFETSIRPLLVDKCGKCHGAEKQWGSLRLDSREALLRGGDSGPAVVSGKPKDSLLIRAVRHEDEDLKMPPKEEKLTERQIADLVRWIEKVLPSPNRRVRTSGHATRIIGRFSRLRMSRCPPSGTRRGHSRTWIVSFWRRSKRRDCHRRHERTNGR